MAHINSKIDYTVSAYIIYSDKVLLRNHEKYSLWLPPGGHIEIDEDLIDALYREVAEETGLDVEIISGTSAKFEDDSSDLPLPMVINKHFTEPGHQHIDFLYLVRAKSDAINPSEGEMADQGNFKWFTKGELIQNSEIKPRVKEHALKALQLAAIT